MNSNIAQAALAFLQRVQLQGSEVEAYMAVRAALGEFVEATPSTEEALEGEEVA